MLTSPVEHIIVELNGETARLTPWTIDRTSPDPARHMTFFLGSARPRHLEHSPVPLFISAVTLAKYKRHGDRFPKARCLWALDSGGFSALDRDGCWGMDPDTFGGMVYRFMEDCGTPVFCAPQDYMCEPRILAKTGLTVPIHQELTTESLLYLREEFPHAPWIPVLQGQSIDDYLAHAAGYEAAGVDLAAEPLVGLGSVCRRQATTEIGAIISVLHARGYRLHAFGVKIAGLRQYGHLLSSADSLAWSSGARIRNIKLPGCTHRGPCNNCLTYGLRWREAVLATLRTPKQLSLGFDFDLVS